MTNIKPAQRSMIDPVAERLVLGAMMLSPEMADQISDVVEPHHFCSPANAAVFRAITRALMLGEPTTVEAIGSALLATGDLTGHLFADLGGGGYLVELVKRVDSPADGMHFVKVLDACYQARQLDQTLIRGIQQLRQPDVALDAVREEIQQSLHDATMHRAVDDPTLAADLIDAVLARIEDVAEGKIPSGMRSGLGSLDDVTGGWFPGQLIIPAARPGVGKTVAGMGFAKACAREGRPALFFSTEMLHGEMLMRLLSDVANVEHDKLKRGQIDDEVRTRLNRAAAEIRSWPLHLIDYAHTTASVRAISRRMHQQYGGVGLVVVDYIQRLRPTEKFERKDLEIGQHAQELKSLAMDLETSVVALAQLNRNSEQRVDKRPALSDLRGSGELEQEADVVIMLHREELSDPESERAGEAEFIVEKNRAGPLDTVSVAAQMHYCRFVDMGV